VSLGGRIDPEEVAYVDGAQIALLAAKTTRAAAAAA
jgi:hypothetical protein